MGNGVADTELQQGSLARYTMREKLTEEARRTDHVIQNADYHVAHVEPPDQGTTAPQIISRIR